MRTRTAAFVLIGLAMGMLVPGPAQAQAEPESIAQLYVVSVRPGSASLFESAFKGYIEWRKAHGDPWTWNVGIAVNGDALGRYVIVSGGHTWADLDAYATQDPDPGGSRFNAHVGQYLDSVVSRISQRNSLVSNMPEDLSEYSFFRVISYELRDQALFMATAAKFHAALQQANWPAPYWFSTVIGGPLTVDIVLPARNWAGFKPPEKAVPQVLTEALGEEETAKLFERFARSWRSASSVIWQMRPDLSLNPAP